MDNTAIDFYSSEEIGPVSDKEYVRTINAGFADRFKEAIIRGGLEKCTQAELALRFGLSPPMINFFTKGKRLPSMETAIRICDITNVSLDWLMTGKGTPGGNFDLDELWANCSEEDRVAFLANLAARHNR